MAEGKATRRTLWWVALAAWVCFIWGNSLLAGPESDAHSLWFAHLLSPAFDLAGITDISMVDHIVRKTAHFCEYLVLGLLAISAFRPSPHGAARADGRDVPRRGFVRPVALAAIVPVIDECIQLGVPGRSGQPTDVLLDMCGAATGLLIGLLVLRRRRSGEA
jgi:VanZ family protein